MSGFKFFISTLLSICMLGLQVTKGYGAKPATKTVRVAYIGIQFQGDDKNIEEDIDARISQLLKKESLLYYVSEKEIKNRLNAPLRDKIISGFQEEDFRMAAELLNVDYVFAGKIKKQNTDEDFSVLTGNVIRYDVDSNRMYSISIKSFTDNFEQELNKVDKQLVQTIVPKKRKGFLARYLPGFVILAATVVATVLLLGGTSGQGSRGGGQSPPFTEY